MAIFIVKKKQKKQRGQKSKIFFHNASMNLITLTFTSHLKPYKAIYGIETNYVCLSVLLCVYEGFSGPFCLYMGIMESSRCVCMYACVCVCVFD